MSSNITVLKLDILGNQAEALLLDRFRIIFLTVDATGGVWFGTSPFSSWGTMWRINSLGVHCKWSHYLKPSKTQ